jgi:hypothetical protein
MDVCKVTFAENPAKVGGEYPQSTWQTAIVSPTNITQSEAKSPLRQDPKLIPAWQNTERIHRISIEF